MVTEYQTSVERFTYCIIFLKSLTAFSLIITAKYLKTMDLLEKMKPQY